MKWCIYYSDGSTFSSADGEPQDAPGWGVVAIGQGDDEVGTAVFRGRAWYVFDLERYGGWREMDEWGFAQYVATPGFKIVKMAESILTREYKLLISSLQKDPYMPCKTARYHWEPPF